MINYMKNVIIVRDRGQITIPGSIRKVVNWVSPMSAVTISILKPDEIVIRPHNVKVDSEEIWNRIRSSRAIKGEGRYNASEFLIRDRNSH
ncbi:hypothetical protein COV24_00425 [candidate division WWE3 bacterium CG10_big_fil_rev_8_21_14_0_10_32_10]|uniref:Uncharacterized protein n=1 Tax=candidate division WWE3 bacterium CG10_big_fil_rev_8_21_14_0_10_32_10 TaxID=1975090 RepID=A0A2H0RBF4_UNCKA|nr:MAG: hypothetical protein COV24_00425 [candidate division WWE3 bacterium CG10_big_fil_rev_8_21_14_0_10_32_10]